MERGNERVLVLDRAPSAVGQFKQPRGGVPMGNDGIPCQWDTFMGAWRQSDGTVRRTGDRFMTAWSSSWAPVGTHGKAHAGAQQQQQQPLPLALTTSSAAAANTIDATNASDGRSGSHAAVCAASVTAVHAAAQAIMRSTSEGLSAAIDDQNCPLICPIEQDGHMKAPVTLACGCNFEMSAIKAWLLKDKTCPTCRQKVPRGFDPDSLKINRIVLQFVTCKCGHA
jgi:hypothetical protein